MRSLADGRKTKARPPRMPECTPRGEHRRHKQAMNKKSIAEQAAEYAASAAAGAQAANVAAKATQDAANKRFAGSYAGPVSAWEWAEYAEQSARRAGEYARAAAAAASAHDIPEAKRRLRNAQDEAHGAWSNAEHAGHQRPA